MIVATTEARIHVAPEGSALFVAYNPENIGAFALGRRPCHLEYRKRHFIVGQWSKGIIIDEYGNMNPMGMEAPHAPTLSAVGGGTIAAGNFIGYLEFRRKVGSTVIHRSNLSEGSSIVALSGSEQRQWDIDSFAPIGATHIGLMVSANGAIPKEAAEVTVGTTTYTEDVATSLLGYIPPVDADGNLKQARGVPPYARIAVRYHRRAWFGGDPAFPHRWWYSELDEYESVGSLNYIDHLDAETAVGAVEAGDHLLTLGAEVAYVIQGWDEADFRIYKVEGSSGTICHWAIAKVGGIPWIPNEHGISMYVPGAGFRPLLSEVLRSEWTSEYQSNRSGFEDSFAIEDREESVYILAIPYASNPRTRRWIGDFRLFDPSVGDGSSAPRWCFDKRDRVDKSMGLFRPAGSKQTGLYTGSCDGHIRRENDYTNGDDDGDSYGKPLIFEPPHFQPGGQAGDDRAGFTFTDIDLYLKSEQKDWTWEARAGDDSAYLATQPADSATVPASALAYGNLSGVPVTAHHITPVEVAGKGLSLRVTIPQAIGVEYRGLGIRWIPGHQSRGFIG